MEIPGTQEPVYTVELDEIHTYAGQKNYCWTWVAVDRKGKKLIDFTRGKRDTCTFGKLWGSIKNRPVKKFFSDHWMSYAELPPENRHVASKAETYTVEGYNSRIRHYLARFRRKTKCYSKSQHMPEISLKLPFLKLNGMPSIFD